MRIFIALAIGSLLWKTALFAEDSPDQTISDLPDLTQSLRLDDYAQVLADLMVKDSLAYKGFTETFDALMPRVDMVFVTKVREDVTRFRIVGKNVR